MIQISRFVLGVLISFAAVGFAGTVAAVWIFISSLFKDWGGS